MTEIEQIKKEYKQTEKEYAELKIKNHDYAIWATDKIAELEKENAELKEENKKLRCCENCKHYGDIEFCKVACKRRSFEENKDCDDKWELAE